VLSLPEDGSTEGYRIIVLHSKIRRWTKSKSDDSVIDTVSVLECVAWSDVWRKMNSNVNLMFIGPCIIAIVDE
jgi:hypothetical protein